MIKLLIADDEKWVCALIESMIDFPRLDLELVGTAYDGQEAIRMIRELRPEIVITDIKMPCADGLQVIKAARDAALDTRFIILSGYSTFEYAKTAVRYHVEDYLLKPISAPQLTEALEKLCAAIRTQYDQRAELRQLRGNLEATTERVRAHLLSNVVYSPFLLSGKSMETLNAEYHFHFVPGSFQIMLLHALPLENDLSTSHVLRKLDQILKSRLAIKCCEYESLIDQHRIVILINYDNALQSIMPEIIDYSFRASLVVDQISKLIQCTLYMGTPVRQPEALGLSFQKAESITNLGILCGLGACYIATDTVAPEGATASLTSAQQETLLAALTGGVQSDLFSFCDGLLAQWSARLSVCPVELDGLLASVFQAVDQHCEKGGFSLPDFTALRDEFFFNFRDCRSSAALSRLLAEALIQLSASYRDSVCAKQSLPVTRAKEYIQAHYAEKLSVERLSEAVYLSPNYFSALFKKETGMSFSDYVAQVRIERAKVLLADPRYTIAQVGEAVGYTDPRYFSRLFKKVIGIKPQDYRKICALSRGIGGSPAAQEGKTE